MFKTVRNGRTRAGKSDVRVTSIAPETVVGLRNIRAAERLARLRLDDDGDEMLLFFDRAPMADFDEFRWDFS